MPTFDVSRYTQPFWFSYSLPPSFSAENAQLGRAMADAASQFASWRKQSNQTTETLKLLEEGASPADIIYQRTGKAPPNSTGATKPEVDANRALRVADQHLDLYGYRPYSEAKFPEKARRFYTGRAELAQAVQKHGWETIPERVVDQYLGGDEMRQPMTKPEEPMTRGKASKAANDLLDYYRLNPSKAKEMDMDFMSRYNKNRAYLNQYIEAAGDAPEEIVRGIMQGDRPQIPAKKAEDMRKPESPEQQKVMAEDAPPANVAEQIRRDVKSGAVPINESEAPKQPEESYEQFTARQQAAREAATRQAVTEAKGITIEVPVPGMEGQTRKVKLQGGIALAASKLPPEQLTEMSELLYEMTQAGVDPGRTQQLINIMAHPEKLQHLLRIIQDGKAKREAEAAVEADPKTRSRGGQVPYRAAGIAP